MSTTRIGPKHQVTIPKEVFENLKLEVGDFLDVRVSGDAIAMIPQKLIPKDQAWFHTPEWQQKEREADRAVARREISGPFTSAEALLKHLGKRKMSRKK
jgi:antitoxin MazE